MKGLTQLFILSFLILFFSCGKGVDENKYSFYHWKSKAVFSAKVKEAVEIVNAKKIYIHYFDIEALNEADWRSDGIYPTYVLSEVYDDFKQFEIIPVVYITNNILKTSKLNISNLSERIRKLINQISLRQFNKEINEIQIDCDWTESTKYVYFELLKKLQKKFDVDVTIRLHQIKFKERTGVPPVSKGTLMLYNMGDLKNKEQNSIIEKDIVKQYINSETDYPFKLNIALPIFSQTVLSNNNDRIKIIKDTDRQNLENDSHFKKIDNNNFKIVQDTLYKGFYLSEGYNLELEEIEESEIIGSYQTITKSKLLINEIIFYHLDDSSLNNIDLKTLKEQL